MKKELRVPLYRQGDLVNFRFSTAGKNFPAVEQSAQWIRSGAENRSQRLNMTLKAMIMRLPGKNVFINILMKNTL